MKRLLRKISRVPTLTDYYDKSNYDFIELGVRTINVDDILGMCDGRNEEYNEDFSPIDAEDNYRWNKVYEGYKNGDDIPLIPLVKTPDGKYFGYGDGSHRISVLKTLDIKSIDAKITVMVPKEKAINKQWIEYSKEKQEEYDKLSRQYNLAIQKFNEIIDRKNDNYDNYKKEYDIAYKEMNLIGEKLNEIGEQLDKEEGEFKKQLLQQYLVE